jgi:glyoxylase-like metal-dependent hydrolase (beta-lactamase superfamily II)
MLEDDFTDVLRKALTGNGCTASELAKQANLTTSRVSSLLNGHFDASTATTVAPYLGLNPVAFAAHTKYDPTPPKMAAITQLDMPFETGQVNAWHIDCGGQSVLVDTGCDPQLLMKQFSIHGLSTPDLVLITHAHRDHIGSLDFLINLQVPVKACAISGTQALVAGDSLHVGSVRIEVLNLSGHADPACGFLFHGLAEPILACGDALFAGSIGGCASPATYRMALENLQFALAPLPDSTILLPGHGPASSLGQERCRNPFLSHPES